MMALPDDPLWPEFKPLWSDLQQAGGLLLVAGGYGLFLKQQWLLAHQDIPTIVPLPRWLDATPRVTKDVDIVVGLKIIASEESMALMAQALARHDFKPIDPRWQFGKPLGGHRQMLVEFHSPLPAPSDKNLGTDKKRVKHKPSLGEEGIHGRQNPEAIGCDHHPFQFEIDRVALAVPNAVTWCLMKLAALRDRRQRSADETRDEESRRIDHEQAMKHARDVCRAVALVTAEERNRADSVIEIIRQSAEYQRARQICAEFFTADGWGTRVAANLWPADDLELLRQILADWFPPQKE